MAVFDRFALSFCPACKEKTDLDTKRICGQHVYVQKSLRFSWSSDALTSMSSGSPEDALSCHRRDQLPLV